MDAIDKKKELLKKLQALAERGVGGEKETAERKIRQLMKKYGIDEMEFTEDKLEKIMRMQQMMMVMQDKSLRPLLEAAE